MLRQIYMCDDKPVPKDAALDPLTFNHFITFVRQLILSLFTWINCLTENWSSYFRWRFYTIPGVTSNEWREKSKRLPFFRKWKETSIKVQYLASWWSIDATVYILYIFYNMLVPKIKSKIYFFCILNYAWGLVKPYFWSSLKYHTI